MQEAAPTKSTRYHALDIWRGIVCVIVVLEHAAVCLWSVPETLQESGWARRAIVTCLTLNIGAPLIFVISVYCIASSLESSQRKGITPIHFLARRLWRIFPPYWVSMAVIAAVVIVLDRVGLDWLHRTTVGLELFAPSDFTTAQWIGNITLTETWRPLIAGTSGMLLNRVSWALCYQEQFYLVCFLALIFFPRKLHLALAGATLAIVGFHLVTRDIGSDKYYYGLFPDLWHEFAVGLLLFWRINVAQSALSKRAVEVGLLALFAIGCWSGAVSTAAAAAFGLLLILCYRWDAAVARISRLNPLRACGKRSYSVYLIHLPVCTVGNAGLAAMGMDGFWLRALVMVPVVTIASIGAGWIFYGVADRRFTALPSFKGWGPKLPTSASRGVVGVEA